MVFHPISSGWQCMPSPLQRLHSEEFSSEYLLIPKELSIMMESLVIGQRNVGVPTLIANPSFRAMTGS